MTLLIICFFFFKSYALSEEHKAISKENHSNTGINYGDMGAGTAYFADDFTAYVCEGYSRTFTVSGDPNSKYQWYKDSKILRGETSNALSVNSAGKYTATVDGKFATNSVTVIMSKIPAKPRLTFID